MSEQSVLCACHVRPGSWIKFLLCMQVSSRLEHLDLFWYQQGDRV